MTCWNVLRVAASAVALAIVGDFNIHVDDITDTGSRKLLEISEAQYVTQHVEAAMYFISLPKTQK